jgi:hypothetical protein
MLSCEALRLLDSGFLPIPSKEKRPAVKHKPPPGGAGPLWSRDVARRNLELFDRFKELGVLCDDGVIVIDFDDVASYHTLRSKGFGQAFDTTVLARTRKGFHVWFRRTPLCEELGFYDGPMGFFTDASGKKQKKPMDIKTITRVKTTVLLPQGTCEYHTPGFCATFPSANKVWMNSPHNVALLPMPDDLLRLLHHERHASDPVVPRAVAPSAPRQLPVSSVSFWRPCMLDEPCLTAMGFPRDKMRDIFEYASMNDNMTRAGYVNGTMQFKLVAGTKCPLCAKPDGHGNSYWVGHMKDGTRRTLNHTSSCTPNGRRSAVLVPWTTEGVTRWLSAMRSEGTAASSQIMEAFENAYNWFTRPREGFFYKSSLVFVCNEGYGIVQYALNKLIGGFPRAGLAAMPWIDELPDPWPVPISPAFFLALEESCRRI